MPFDNYLHKFSLAGTRVIYVPTETARRGGAKLCREVLKRWEPPEYFYHLKDGGHVAAARAHLASHLFVRLDLSKFFDAINRSRLHRALRRIGFRHPSAWEAACDSTVGKVSPLKGYTLPFGFVQSPLLASLALSSSALGGALAKLHGAGMRVSVYMDDILLSGDDDHALRVARRALEAAAEVSRFEFNALKSVGPVAELEVFNLILTHESLEVSTLRLSRFAVELTQARAAGKDDVANGILSYIGTVNADQRRALA